MKYLLHSFNQSALQRYFKNTSWALIEKFWRMGLTLLVGIFISRHLGPEQHGLYGFVLSYIGIFASLAPLGVYGILLRDLSATSEKEYENRYLGTAVTLNLIGATSTYFIIGISLFFNDLAEQTIIFCMIAASILLMQFTTVIECYFQVKVRAKVSTIAQGGAVLITNIFKIYGIITGKELSFFIWVVVVEQVLISLGLLIAYRLEGFSMKNWQFDKSLAINILKIRVGH